MMTIDDMILSARPPDGAFGLRQQTEDLTSPVAPVAQQSLLSLILANKYLEDKLAISVAAATG